MSIINFNFIKLKRKDQARGHPGFLMGELMIGILIFTVGVALLFRWYGALIMRQNASLNRLIHLHELYVYSTSFIHGNKLQAPFEGKVSVEYTPLIPLPLLAAGRRFDLPQGLHQMQIEQEKKQSPMSNKITLVSLLMK